MLAARSTDVITFRSVLLGEQLVQIGKINVLIIIESTHPLELAMEPAQILEQFKLMRCFATQIKSIVRFRAVRVDHIPERLQDGSIGIFRSLVREQIDMALLVQVRWDPTSKEIRQT